MKTAYIDFDGTIVDVMPRYHGILTSYLKGTLKICLESFCNLKRQGLKEHQIVEIYDPTYPFYIPDYVEFKRERLESMEWLALDRVIGDPILAHEQLNLAGFNVHLLTQRRNEKNVYAQLKQLGLWGAFDEVSVVAPMINGNAKASFLKGKVTPEDIVVGDSPVDMECARLLGITGFFVETGLWCEPNEANVRILPNYNAVASLMVIGYGKRERYSDF